MADESSIGPWLRGLQQEDAQAMQMIWDRFFEKLVGYANQRLREMPKLQGTGEDIAVSVFESLWNGYQAGRFRDVSNQSELWWTLLKMARNKCIDHLRRETAAKRGGNTPNASLSSEGESEQEFYESLVSQDPDPQYLATIADEYQRCMTLLRDTHQRQIAALTMEGYSPREISERLDLSESSVRRKLRIIRETWNLGTNSEQSDAKSIPGSRQSDRSDL